MSNIFREHKVFVFALVFVIAFAIAFSLAIKNSGIFTFYEPVDKDHAVDDQSGPYPNGGPYADDPAASTANLRLTPHIISLGGSNIGYYDGKLYFTATVLEKMWRTPIPNAKGVMRDYGVIHGETYLMVSSGIGMSRISNTETGEIVQFPTSSETHTRSAVVDVPRRRIFTLGQEDHSVRGSQSLRSSSLRMRDLKGQVLAPAYDFYGRGSALAADQYCDTLVVGTGGGIVHVFRTTQDGFEPILHRSYGIGGVASVSCRGNDIAATFDRGVRIIRMVGGAIQNEFVFPEDVESSKDISWFNKTIHSSVVSDAWAACSVDNTLHCVNLSTMKVERDIEFRGVIHGLCAVVQKSDHVVAVLFELDSPDTPKGTCAVWTVNLSTGAIHEVPVVQDGQAPQ